MTLLEMKKQILKLIEEINPKSTLLTDDPDILGPLSFLRQREIIHYQRFKELRDYYLDIKNKTN